MKTITHDLHDYKQKQFIQLHFLQNHKNIKSYAEILILYLQNRFLGHCYINIYIWRTGIKNPKSARKNFKRCIEPE